VHGDVERLFQALKPYPPDRCRTIFLGDLVDYGMFGVGALRYARDRPQTSIVLGNHEVAMLWALNDPERVGWFISIGGHKHDIDELARDTDLQAWLVSRPTLIQLPDQTLVQHCGHDGYSRWLEPESRADPVETINARVRQLLTHHGEADVWEVLSAKNIFDSRLLRLQRWLESTNSRRVVFGHIPHGSATPEIYHHGLATNIDGAFSRRQRNNQPTSPHAASNAPLDVLK
jgi:hypothetical protein